jgi:hypothetical protein
MRVKNGTGSRDRIQFIFTKINSFSSAPVPIHRANSSHSMISGWATCCSGAFPRHTTGWRWCWWSSLSPGYRGSLSPGARRTFTGNIGQQRKVLVDARGRILGHNPDKSLKGFPPCYSQSPLHSTVQLCLEISISSNSRNLLCISTL